MSELSITFNDAVRNTPPTPEEAELLAQYKQTLLALITTEAAFNTFEDIEGALRGAGFTVQKGWVPKKDIERMRVYSVISEWLHIGWINAVLNMTEPPAETA